METTKDLIVGDLEKGLFSRMLDIGVDADLAKKILSFWMFLESKDLKDFLFFEKLNYHDDRVLRFVCAEAEMALPFVLEHNPNKPLPSISCPFTMSTLTNSEISLANILRDQEKVSSEILAIHDNICGIAFDEIVEERGLKVKLGDPDQSAKKISADGEGSSKFGDAENAIDQVSGSTLNPFAKEWDPSVERASVEDRSLFMTFSRGHPISMEEIVYYFEKNYGDCVEDIFIHKPRGREAEFGKIVFKYSNIPSVVLKETEAVKLYIRGKTIFLKKYKPAGELE